jgi:hypothetical protein
MTIERNLRSEIVYVAALSVWSAAIAPTVRIRSRREKRPPIVWSAMISPGGGWDTEWFEVALKALGSKSALPYIRIHPNIHTRHMLQRACKADGRRDIRSAIAASVLGGSPFSSSRSKRAQLAELEPYLRPAWDWGWITEDGRELEDGGPRPSLGVLWEISPQEWEAKSGMLDTATRSRFLCFNIPANRYAHRNPFKGSTEVEQAESHPMTQAIEWIRSKHTLELDEAGAAAWAAVRPAESKLESALGLGRTCRIGEHTLRVAAALAAAECSTSIGQREVAAAWTFVRQAIVDTCEIDDLVLKVPLDDLLADIDMGLRTAIAAAESTEVPRYAPSSSTSVVSITSDSDEDVYYEATPSRFRTTTRIERERDTWKVRQVKAWYNDRCQMCLTRLELPPPARAVSEGAHIQALGGEHLGPDLVENILCLCPNCHTLFDLGARYLTDALEVINAVNGQNLGTLTRHPLHRIGIQYVRSHRARWNIP